MILKFEDTISLRMPKYEYINTEKILYIRIGRKRIRLYSSPYLYMHVSKSKYNMHQLKKWYNEFD